MLPQTWLSKAIVGQPEAWGINYLILSYLISRGFSFQKGGFGRCFLDPKNRNEGTKKGATVPKTRTMVEKKRKKKTGKRVHSQKPPPCLCLQTRPFVCFRNSIGGFVHREKASAESEANLSKPISWWILQGIFWWIFWGPSSFGTKKTGGKNPPQNPHRNSNRSLGASRPKSTLQESGLDCKGI